LDRPYRSRRGCRRSCFCGRSAKAADFLRQSGFKSVKNMIGGILAWSDKVDPSVPKY